MCRSPAPSSRIDFQWVIPVSIKHFIALSLLSNDPLLVDPNETMAWEELAINNLYTPTTHAANGATGGLRRRQN